MYTCCKSQTSAYRARGLGSPPRGKNSIIRAKLMYRSDKDTVKNILLFNIILMRHLLQRTTAHNRRQKTPFVSQFIKRVLTKSSVNFNQGLRAMTRRFCAHWAKSYSAVLQSSEAAWLSGKGARLEIRRSRFQVPL